MKDNKLKTGPQEQDAKENMHPKWELEKQTEGLDADAYKMEPEAFESRKQSMNRGDHEETKQNK